MSLIVLVFVLFSFILRHPNKSFFNVINIFGLFIFFTHFEILYKTTQVLKNEAQSIGGMIESLKGVVDRYTIVDTGSTDRTKEIIKESFGDTPGDIYDEKFIDFATTRNRAIELEGIKSVSVGKKKEQESNASHSNEDVV